MYHMQKCAQILFSTGLCLLTGIFSVPYTIVLVIFTFSKAWITPLCSGVSNHTHLSCAWCTRIMSLIFCQKEMLMLLTWY
uniref:Uncharacterized protein n=1 Tax=Rhizophora mucronata TaxID=61149 RepID=A0A2P2QDF8_RHIMU